MFWTDERVEQLTKLTREGKVFREIAEILGCTRNAVIGKVHRMGLHAQVPVSKKAAARRRAPVNVAKIKAKPPEPPRFRYKPRGPSVSVEMPTPRKHKGLSLLDLEPHHCRFPTGQGAEITFCGQQKLHGYSWCGPCKDVVFRDE
jgi:GcrA cell cycle regulator